MKENKTSRLFHGVKEFRQNDFIDHQEVFKNLRRSQHPHTLFIGCSDSRVVPNLITKSLPGELFIVRNIANLVPFYKEDYNTYVATAAAIEYAMKSLKVDNIIICGHSNCGGCKALFSDNSLEKMPLTRKWLDLAAYVKMQVLERMQYKKLNATERNTLTEQLNVIEQMNHLLTFPYVKKKFLKGELSILGWYYVIETGDVYNYSPEKLVFERIE